MGYNDHGTSEAASERLRAELNKRLYKPKTYTSIQPDLPQSTIDKQLNFIEKHNEIRKPHFILETNSQRVIEAYNKMTTNP